MNGLKKVLSCLCAATVICCLFTTDISAAPEAEVVSANEGTNSLQEISEVNLGTPEEMSFDTVEISTNETEVISGVTDGQPTERDLWRLPDDVFVGNGSLTDSNISDSYYFTVEDSRFALLRINSSNTNIVAMLYVMNDGKYEQTNFLVNANQGIIYANIPTGDYFLAVGSYSGSERGNYTLMWNCSNPAGPSYLIDVAADLSRTMVYYNLSNLFCNGANILDGAKFEEQETTYLTHGHIATSMSLTVMPDRKNGRPSANGVFTASFSSSAPYSTSRALFINVNSGSWCYYNSSYSNVEGEVHHTIDYTDLSGLKTPRTFGTGANDFSYGPNYLVIDLNTYQVVDFVSPFNYNYNSGRTYTVGEPTPIA